MSRNYLVLSIIILIFLIPFQLFSYQWIGKGYRAFKPQTNLKLLNYRLKINKSEIGGKARIRLVLKGDYGRKSKYGGYLVVKRDVPLLSPFKLTVEKLNFSGKWKEFPVKVTVSSGYYFDLPSGRYKITVEVPDAVSNYPKTKQLVVGFRNRKGKRVLLSLSVKLNGNKRNTALEINKKEDPEAGNKRFIFSAVGNYGVVLNESTGLIRYEKVTQKPYEADWTLTYKGKVIDKLSHSTTFIFRPAKYNKDGIYTLRAYPQKKDFIDPTIQSRIRPGYFVIRLLYFSQSPVSLNRNVITSLSISPIGLKMDQLSSVLVIGKGGHKCDRPYHFKAIADWQYLDNSGRVVKRLSWGERGYAADWVLEYNKKVIQRVSKSQTFTFDPKKYTQDGLYRLYAFLTAGDPNRRFLTHNGYLAISLKCHLATYTGERITAIYFSKEEKNRYSPTERIPLQLYCTIGKYDERGRGKTLKRNVRYNKEVKVEIYKLNTKEGKGEWKLVDTKSGYLRFIGPLSTGKYRIVVSVKNKAGKILKDSRQFWIVDERASRVGKTIYYEIKIKVPSEVMTGIYSQEIVSQKKEFIYQAFAKKAKVIHDSSAQLEVGKIYSPQPYVAHWKLKDENGVTLEEKNGKTYLFQPCKWGNGRYVLEAHLQERDNGDFNKNQYEIDPSRVPITVKGCLKGELKPIGRRRKAPKPRKIKPVWEEEKNKDELVKHNDDWVLIDHIIPMDPEKQKKNIETARSSLRVKPQLGACTLILKQIWHRKKQLKISCDKPISVIRDLLHKWAEFRKTYNEYVKTYQGLKEDLKKILKPSVELMKEYRSLITEAQKNNLLMDNLTWLKLKNANVFAKGGPIMIGKGMPVNAFVYDKAKVALANQLRKKQREIYNKWGKLVKKINQQLEELAKEYNERGKKNYQLALETRNKVKEAQSVLRKMFRSNKYEHCLGADDPNNYYVDNVHKLPGMKPLPAVKELPKVDLATRKLKPLHKILPLHIKLDGIMQLKRDRKLAQALAEAARLRYEATSGSVGNFLMDKALKLAKFLGAEDEIVGLFTGDIKNSLKSLASKFGGSTVKAAKYIANHPEQLIMGPVNAAVFVGKSVVHIPKSIADEIVQIKRGHEMVAQMEKNYEELLNLGNSPRENIQAINLLMQQANFWKEQEKTTNASVMLSIDIATAVGPKLMKALKKAGIEEATAKTIVKAFTKSFKKMALQSKKMGEVIFKKLKLEKRIGKLKSLLKKTADPEKVAQIRKELTKSAQELKKAEEIIQLNKLKEAKQAEIVQQKILKMKVEYDNQIFEKKLDELLESYKKRGGELARKPGKLGENGIISAEMEKEFIELVDKKKLNELIEFYKKQGGRLAREPSPIDFANKIEVSSARKEWEKIVDLVKKTDKDRIGDMGGVTKIRPPSLPEKTIIKPGVIDEGATKIRPGIYDELPETLRRPGIIDEGATKIRPGMYDEVPSTIGKGGPLAEGGTKYKPGVIDKIGGTKRKIGIPRLDDTLVKPTGALEKTAIIPEEANLFKKAPKLNTRVVGKKIGSGGMAEVFEVKGRPNLVVKVFKKGVSAATAADEYAGIKLLEKEGIPVVKARGIAKIKGHPVIIKDRFRPDEITVDKLLKHRPLTPKEQLAILKFYDDAARKGIVFGDPNPGNLAISYAKDGTIMVRAVEGGSVYKIVKDKFGKIAGHYASKNVDSKTAREIMNTLFEYKMNWRFKGKMSDFKRLQKELYGKLVETTGDKALSKDILRKFFENGFTVKNNNIAKAINPDLLKLYKSEKAWDEFIDRLTRAERGAVRSNAPSSTDEIGTMRQGESGNIKPDEEVIELDENGNTVRRPTPEEQLAKGGDEEIIEIEELDQNGNPIKKGGEVGEPEVVEIEELGPNGESLGKKEVIVGKGDSLKKATPEDELAKRGENSSSLKKGNEEIIEIEELDQNGNPISKDKVEIVGKNENTARKVLPENKGSDEVPTMKKSVPKANTDDVGTMIVKKGELPVKKLNKDELGEFINSGSAGDVYQLKNKPDEVVKLFRVDSQNPVFSPKNAELRLKHEFDALNMLKKEGIDHVEMIGDKAVEIDGVKGIIKRKFKPNEIEVADIVKKRPLNRQEQEALVDFLDKMTKKGIVPFDFNEGNILFERLPNGKLKVKLVEGGGVYKIGKHGEIGYDVVGDPNRARAVLKEILEAKEKNANAFNLLMKLRKVIDNPKLTDDIYQKIDFDGFSFGGSNLRRYIDEDLLKKKIYQKIDEQALKKSITPVVEKPLDEINDINMELNKKMDDLLGDSPKLEMEGNDLKIDLGETDLNVPSELPKLDSDDLLSPGGLEAKLPKIEDDPFKMLDELSESPASPKIEELSLPQKSRLEKMPIVKISPNLPQARPNKVSPTLRKILPVEKQKPTLRRISPFERTKRKILFEKKVVGDETNSYLEYMKKKLEVIKKTLHKGGACE